MDSSKHSKQLGIGIIGCGRMAHAHATAYRQIEGCELSAACDLRPKELGEFCRKHDIPRSYESAEALLADPGIDAVSVVTPDASHAELSIAALRAGKHVLCEKPLALNYQEARQMLISVSKDSLQGGPDSLGAQKRSRINMVNLSYRNAPAIQKAREIILSGEIGEVVHLRAGYLQSWLSSSVWGDWRSDPHWLWRLSSRHGSKGVLGDVGVHILDFASYPLGPSAGAFERLHCQLATFEQIKGRQLAEQPDYILDANDSALISVEFAGGALGSIDTTRWATGHVNSLTLGIYGNKGAIEIDLDSSPSALQLCDRENKDRAHWYTIKCSETPSNFQHFVRSILNLEEGGSGNGLPDFARGAEIQRVLDACFLSAEQGRQLRVAEIL